MKNLSPKKVGKISKLVQQIREMSRKIEEYQRIGNEEMVNWCREKREDFIRKLSDKLDFG